MIYSYNKNQQDALFLNFVLVQNSTCFGRTYCPSSGVLILHSQQLVFLISNFRHVLKLNVCILLGISLASDYGLPTFRNTLSVPSSYPAYEDGTDRVFRNVGKP